MDKYNDYIQTLPLSVIDFWLTVPPQIHTIGWAYVAVLGWGAFNQTMVASFGNVVL